MPFVSGQSGNPAGRPKGSMNKSSQVLRESLSFLIEENLDKMNEWIDRIAEDDPRAAFQCMVSIMEFNIPKLTRTVIKEEKDDTAGPPATEQLLNNPSYQAILEEIKRGQEEDDAKWERLIELARNSGADEVYREMLAARKS